jgi:hypothetical protein
MNLTIMTRFSMTPCKTLTPTVRAETLAWYKRGCLIERLRRKEFGFAGIHSTIQKVVDGFTSRSVRRGDLPRLSAKNLVAIRLNLLNLVYVQSWFRKIETKFAFQS